MSSRHRAKPIATQVQVLLLRFGHGITTFLEPDIGIVMTNGGSVRKSDMHGLRRECPVPTFLLRKQNATVTLSQAL